MTDLNSSTPTLPIPPDQEFAVLRQIGIEHLQSLSGELWTDYNLHDPGVTILEVLCYALTDLSYRTHFNLQDLLALNRAAPSTSQETNFFTPDQVLTCNPVTAWDWQRRLMDIAGVRHGELQPVETYPSPIYIDCQQSCLRHQPPHLRPGQQVRQLQPRGFYHLYLELEADLTPAERQATLAQVKTALWSHRNLCEDFLEMTVWGQQQIGLCSTIELEASADPERVLVDIYGRVQDFLNPPLQFYTLQELLARGKPPETIFAGRPSALHDPQGAYISHGFIDPDEFAARISRSHLYTSDFYQLILDIPGVVAIKKLILISSVRDAEGEQQSQHPWQLPLWDQYRPVLSIAHSAITFYKGDLPFRLDSSEVERRFREQQTARIKAQRSAYELDGAIPQGRYADLADHYSIQHDFPLTYGIGEAGLPATASVLRKAQAKQLKGYLVFFDQLLANYLSQLAHIRQLFSWESLTTQPPDQQHTYFAQGLDFPDAQQILRQTLGAGNAADTNPPATDYAPRVAALTEDEATYLDRRQRFLDHLLARFAESFTDYVLLNYGIAGGRRDPRQIIEDKARFLQAYPVLSHDRFRAFDYADSQGIWDTENVIGLQKRVCRLLGIQDFQRRTLAHYRVVADPGGFVLTLAWGDSSLLGQSIYESPEAAQAAAETLRDLASQPDRYQRLVYTHPHLQGWQVRDQSGEALAVYEAHFDDALGRDQALSALQENLSTLLAGLEAAVWPPDWIHISSLPLEQFSFELAIPRSSGAIMRFTGLLGYATEGAARTAATTTLNRLRQWASPADARPLPTPAVFRPYRWQGYGYGLVTSDGTWLAISPNRWLTPGLRDQALQAWLDGLEADQPTPDITQQPSAYLGQLSDRAGQPLLHHQNRHPYGGDSGQSAEAAEAAAWQDGQVLMEQGQDPANLCLIETEAAAPTYYWTLAQPHQVPHPTWTTSPYGTPEQRSLAIQTCQTLLNDEGMHSLEHMLLLQGCGAAETASANAEPHPVGDPRYPMHILLQPLATHLEEENQDANTFLPIQATAPDCQPEAATQPCLTHLDPYSFWVSILLPYWPVRFRDMNFRRQVEHTLRLEAPAHVALKICWLDLRQMHAFEGAYRHWLEHLALAQAHQEHDLPSALKQLLAIFTQLHSVYPQGTLHDCEDEDTSDNPIILDQTALGTTTPLAP